MRRSGLRLAIAAALLVAPGTARSAEDETAFARALAQRGYIDLAERVLRRASANTSSSAARRAESRLALAQLRRFEAMRAVRASASGRSGDEATLRIFRDAESAYRALLSDSVTGRAARIELARLLASHAELVGLGGTTEPVAPLLDELMRLIDDAEATARAEASAAAPESPARSRAEDEIASLRLLRIQALHVKGARAQQGDREGAAALGRALDEIEKFTWDYAGTLRCAWAFRWRGLVLARLGRTAEACESLRDAATSVSERDALRGADEMSLAAYEELARTAASAQGADSEEIVGMAVAAAEQLSADWPRHVESAAGRRARLAMARLHDRAGDRRRAIADAEAVLGATGDDDPGATEEACALLSDWMETGGSAAATVDPAVMARIAQSSARTGDFERTVHACRTLISACVTSESRDRWAWDAWETMGRAYGTAGRWFEAFLVFDRIERAWRTDPSNTRLAEMTDTTAWYRADALGRLAAETHDPEDRAVAEAAVADFARDHPLSGFASGAREQAAFRAMSEAAALRRAGTEPAATIRGREALAALASIGEESPLFDRAQALAAEAHRQLGEIDEAIRLSEAWLDAKRPEPLSPAVKRARDQGRAQALVTLLTAKTDRAAATLDAQAKKDAFRDVIATLAKREAEFLAAVPKGRDQVESWRAEALLGVGDVDAAEPLVLAQIRSRPSHSGTRYLAGSAARAVEAAASQVKDAGRARDLSLRAAHLWEFVLQTSDAHDPEIARAAGMAFRAGADPAHAADLLSLAVGLYRGEADKASDPVERNRCLDRARSMTLELARTLIVLSRLDEAEAEAAALLASDEPDGGSALTRLSQGETLRGPDVEWLVRRAAKSRSALETLGAAHAGSSSRQHLAAAAQIVSALRYTLPRDAAPTAESYDLALRHADLLLRLGGAGGPAEAALAADGIVNEALGSDEALAEAERLLPGAGKRVDDLRRRIAEDSKR